MDNQARIYHPDKYFTPPPAPSGWVPDAECPFESPDYVVDPYFMDALENCPFFRVDKPSVFASKKKKDEYKKSLQIKYEKYVESDEALHTYKSRFEAWREVQWAIEYNRLMNKAMNEDNTNA